MTWLDVAIPFWCLVVVLTAAVSAIWSVLRHWKPRKRPSSTP